MHITPPLYHPIDHDVLEHWFNQAECQRAVAEALSERLD